MSKVTSYALLRSNRLSVNGELLFEKAGDLDGFLEAAYLSLNAAYPRFYRMDRMGKAGFLSSEALFKRVPVHYPASSVSLVLSNAHSSLDTDLRYFETTKTFASPALFVYTLPNIVAGEICIRHGFKGENTFFISPKFDAEQMTRYVDLVLAGKQTQACIAGWVDVLQDQAEVFLYLAEKKNEDAIEHTSKNILALYEEWNS